MTTVPLTDDAWLRVCHLFEEPAAGPTNVGRPRRQSRDVLNGVLWVLLNHEKWHHLPSTFPPSQTCYARWLQWKRTGLIDTVIAELEKGDDAPPDSGGAP
ncbi:transposase [Paraburkholderia acidicola]|uniref:Transposase n=1 Tax=Paraburkholderia acidicola TaxID=1912599 RepID=A0A2A4EP11_9BURK|nr:transposase [Paraburkholderia acidicola]PCE22417.1 transposase [Paraburkholderia acidicola]